MYLDKAFDKVFHVSNINKMVKYELDRTGGFIIGCITSINDSTQEWTAVLSRVPQCFILGFMLFNIFINDFINDLMEGLEYQICR